MGHEDQRRRLETKAERGKLRSLTSNVCRVINLDPTAGMLGPHSGVPGHLVCVAAEAREGYRLVLEELQGSKDRRLGRLADGEQISPKGARTVIGPLLLAC